MATIPHTISFYRCALDLGGRLFGKYEIHAASRFLIPERTRHLSRRPKPVLRPRLGAPKCTGGRSTREHETDEIGRRRWNLALSVEPPWCELSGCLRVISTGIRARRHGHLQTSSSEHRQRANPCRASAQPTCSNTREGSVCGIAFNRHPTKNTRSSQ